MPVTLVPDPRTIRGSTIIGNTVRSTNSIGNASAFSGGLHANGSLVLTGSTISDNHVSATASAGLADVDSGASEINVDATISNTHFTGNTATARTSTGTAHARAAGIQTTTLTQLTISDSTISGNQLTAAATTGSASVQGGGIGNFGGLTLRNTRIGHNSATVSGPDSTVTDNTLTADPGSTVQGGGIYTPTTFPVTLTNTVVAHNVPGQCYGC